MHANSLRLGALVALTLSLSGCQTYEADPLDAPAHRSAWLARTAADEPVQDFARRLADQGHEAAASFDPADGLTLAEGELVALVFNPDLRIARLKVGITGAQAEYAGLWEDPRLSLDVLYVTESVPDRWVVTPGLAITIPISGRLEAEQARADAALRAELQRVAAEEWRVRHAVRMAWLDWSAAMLRMEETTALLESLGALTASTERLAEAGEMIQTEAALFTIEEGQRLLELRRREGNARELEQRLRSLMGLAPHAPLSLIPAMEVDASPVEPHNDFVTDRNPTLSQLRLSYDVAERTLEREIRKQYPDLTIGPLYETDQGQSRIGFLGGIPLPIFNANQQGIAEAKAERSLARAAYETALERLVGDAARAWIRFSSARDMRLDLSDSLAPLIDRQLEDARRLLAIGESGGLILLESLVRAQALKLELIDVRLEEQSALAELAFIEGPKPATTATDEAAASTSDAHMETAQ